MTGIGEAVAEAARALVGARFRRQGRDPASGLDCVGLAAAALRGAGLTVETGEDYAQRGGDPGRIVRRIEAAGLVPVDPASAQAGDLLLLAAGPAQHHLAILTGTSFVHADAGLRRVVETPGRPRWPVIAAFRAQEQG